MFLETNVDRRQIPKSTTPPDFVFGKDVEHRAMGVKESSASKSHLKTFSDLAGDVSNPQEQNSANGLTSQAFGDGGSSEWSQETKAFIGPVASQPQVKLDPVEVVTGEEDEDNVAKVLQ
ncbi:unnamed protein product [Soboliphyme baturini]|uniref:PAM2 domain-containing protein n=1 Tax=Soboliphyme baturini TaxID=241478 RepID=A0A183IP42_9BILA|nr:unnamed protein product [Soboliphyme baturini]